MSRKESIRESVLNAAGRKIDANSLPSQQLIAYLTANDSRHTAFQCCVESMEESQRGVSVGSFLLNYIPCFPPSKRMLKVIQSKCAEFTRKNSVCRTVYKDVSALCESLMVRPFAEHRSTSAPSPATSRPQHQQSTSHKSRKYYAAFALQPTVSPHSPCFIKMELVPPPPAAPAQQPSTTAEKTPADEAASGVVTPSSVVCKDYIDQCPLVCSDEVIAQQLGVLGHFWDRYRTNPTVINATRFLIKQMCDGYVTKLPFGPPYYFFRCVTICYLPTLLEWMENDYLCVQTHVYDFLLTLSTHLQLVDSQDVFPGCTEALQQEVIWLLLLVLERQATRKPYDELVWAAAAKCALAVIPPGYRWLIDSRALMQFMQLRDLAELHPRAFTLFAEAFECSILRGSGSGEDYEGPAVGAQDAQNDGLSFARTAADETLSFNTVEMGKLGADAIHEVLALYRRSSTVGARLAFFKVFFVWAVARVATRVGADGGAPGDEVTARRVVECYSVLVSLELFWYMHPLLFYEPQKAHHGLADKVLKDVFLPESNDIAPLAKRIVQTMLDIVAEDAEFPRAIVSAFAPLDAAQGSGARTSAAPGSLPPLHQSANGDGSPLRQQRHPLSARDILYDAMTAVPMMLREAPSDTKTYNVAWRLAFYCLRSCKRSELRADGDKMIEFLAEKLVSSNGAPDDRESTFIRRVCPDLLTSLGLLLRTQPEQAVEAFDAILEWFLFAPSIKQPAGRVMALCHRLLEMIAVSRDIIKTVSSDEDVTLLLLRGTLRISLHTARSLGARTFWALYRALANEQTAAACRTRCALLCILSALMAESGHTTPVICAWNSITFDVSKRIAEFAEKKREKMRAA